MDEQEPTSAPALPPAPPWAARATPEQQVAVVRALLAEQAPHLAGRALRPQPGGQDNAVVRVGRDLAVRLPRTEEAAGLLRTEQRWLPLLAPRLPVPVPVPVLLGEASATFPHPWSVVPWLAGTTADVAPSEPQRLSSGLVAVLRALHVPAPPEAPRSAFRGVPLAARLLRNAEALVGHPRAATLQAELVALARLPGPPGPALWVHGDLHPRNVLVRDGGLAGLLDFGDLHAGDRAVDLGGLWLLLPVAQREHVRRALALDDATWARARGWALVLGALLWHIGGREDDAGFVELGRRGLDEAARG